MGKDNLLVSAAKGAVAGLVGTALMTAAMPLSLNVLRKMDLLPPQPAAPDPRKQPPAKLAQKIAETAFDTHLDRDEAHIAGQAIHWGYGTVAGIMYGVVQSRLRLPHLLHGSLFGGLVTLAAWTLVPEMGLTPPPAEQPAPKNIDQALVLQLYGQVVAFTFHLLGGDKA
ncbi:MAG: DUF1440 domain-containing protein [Chloroflexia bacterium]